MIAVAQMSPKSLVRSAAHPLREGGISALLGSTMQAVLAVSHKPVFVITPPLS